jgi:hypothetical protein
MTARKERTLFDAIPSARASDPSSSFAAVDRINRSGGRRRQCDRVAAALEQAQAFGYDRRITVQELARAMGWDAEGRHMIGRRMSDLVRMGRVRGEIEINGVRRRAMKRCRICGQMTLAFWLEK